MNGIWYIYGSGGFGREVLDIIQSYIHTLVDESYEVVFVDDNSDVKHVNGSDVVRFSDVIPGSKITIAVGEPSLRKELLARVDGLDLQLASAISPLSYVSPFAIVQPGAIIAPFSSIQANASIGRNVVVNTQSICGHDVEVGEGVIISSKVNLGGASKIGQFAYLGMGAVVKEQVELGAWSILSMGSYLYKNIGDNLIVVGNPARASKVNENKKVFK